MTDTWLYHLLKRPKLNWKWHLEREERLCVEIADDLRAQSANGNLKGVWTHAANEGKRSEIVACILKAMGMLSGAYDYWFIGEWGGGIIEIKPPEERKISPKTGKSIIDKPKGELSDSQILFSQWADMHHVPKAVCYTRQEVLDTLYAWGALRVPVTINDYGAIMRGQLGEMG